MTSSNTSGPKTEQDLSEVQRAAAAEVAADQSGLIQTEPSTSYPRAARFSVWVFAITLLMTAVLDRAFSVKPKEPVGIERIEYRRLQSAASFEVHGWDVIKSGAWMRLAEKRLGRTSLVRKTVTPYWALGLYQGLHSGRRNVRIGPEGWLFVEERLEPSKDPEHLVAGWPAAVLAAISRGIEALGIRFSVVPIPRKEIVHKDKLPRGSEPRTGLMPKFLNHCQRSGVEVVDLMPAFERLSGESAYFKTDSHWAPGAEYLAARRTAHALGCLVPPNQRLGEFEPGATVRGGFDLLELLGLPRSMILEAGIKDERRGWTGAHETGANRGVLTSEESTLAIAGTSFSARRYYPLFLAHFFGKKIYNGARIGGNPMNPLQELLVREPRPEHIILEVPGHALFNATPLPTAGDVVPEFKLPGALVVCDPKHIHLTPRFRKGSFQAPRRKVLAQVANGPVGHTGDGVLWWRIRGEVMGEGVGITYMQGDRRLIVPWKEDKRELWIPVCVEEPSWHTGALVLHAPPNGPQMRVDSVELCAFVVEDGAVDFEKGPYVEGREPKSRRQTWTPVGDVKPRVPLGGIFVVNVDPVRKGAQFLTVDVQVAGGETFTTHVYAPPDGVALVGIDKLKGQEIESITFDGDLAPPQGILGRVRLHGMR